MAKEKEGKPSDKHAKPAEYQAFEDLTKQLLSVPKPSLDRKMREYEEKKKRRKKRG